MVADIRRRPQKRMDLTSREGRCYNWGELVALMPDSNKKVDDKALEQASGGAAKGETRVYEEYVDKKNEINEGTEVFKGGGDFSGNINKGVQVFE